MIKKQIHKAWYIIKYVKLEEENLEMLFKLLILKIEIFLFMLEKHFTSKNNIKNYFILYFIITYINIYLIFKRRRL